MSYVHIFNHYTPVSEPTVLFSYDFALRKASPYIEMIKYSSQDVFSSGFHGFMVDISIVLVYLCIYKYVDDKSV